MHKHLLLRFHMLAYALRGGFLIRPFMIALVLGIAGAVLSSLEESIPALHLWVPRTLFPSDQDPQVAQAILTTIATSIMTVVSIVFAILLMTLTLASTQFSPRILISFIRDRTTQWTLGLFLGTFSYCVAALPAARTMPQNFVPVATITGAMLLAPLCVGWLIYFIYHISQAINVNQIVDRIARETELVINDVMPERRSNYKITEPHPQDYVEPRFPIMNRQAGYIRFIDVRTLSALARNYGISVRLERRVGHFVPTGIPILKVSRQDRVNEERATELLRTIEIGPTRTMQQDVEFGIIQIVDIALRAISPAVNDPSTAISCVDQLSRILIRCVGRAPPVRFLYGPPHVLRVEVPWIDYQGLLETAFEQIRHYAVTDTAVSLRILRALGDIASTTEETGIHQAIDKLAARVIAHCSGRLHADDLTRIEQRIATISAWTSGTA
jgi:uncharacterized membrane protein